MLWGGYELRRWTRSTCKKRFKFGYSSLLLFFLCFLWFANAFEGTDDACNLQTSEGMQIDDVGSVSLVGPGFLAVRVRQFYFNLFTEVWLT